MDTSSNVERAGDILLFLGDAGRDGASLAAIAAKVDGNKPSIHRALSSLALRGFVETMPKRGYYRLGPTFFALAARTDTVSEMVEILSPALAELAQLTGCIAYLFLRAGIDGICMDVQHGRSSVQTLTSGIGARLPLGIGAATCCLLAQLETAEQARIIERNTERYRQFADLDADAVTRHVGETIRTGYALERGRFNPATAALATTVPTRLGQPDAAISMAGFIEHFSKPRIIEMRSMISDAFARLATDTPSRLSAIANDGGLLP